MVNSYIGIGSNLGNKEGNIKKAIDLLRKKCKILEISSLYKTEPVGYKNQDWFLNCVVEIDTNFKPKALLEFLKSIEKKLKRIKIIKNGPRIIDLDILFYDNKIIKTKNLTIPHPRLHKRLFVLEPLDEISPNFIHPILNKSINKIKSNLKSKKSVEIYKSTALQA